jgi:hypothetical protein
MKQLLFVTALLLLAVLTVPALDLDVVAESGFLAVLSHRIKYGADERNFQYHLDGGQDVLFPFLRVSAEAVLQENHTVIFLYQPLELETRVELGQSRVIDGETFPADTGLRLLYRFPFYRASYLYKLRQRPRWELEVGGGLQIRNATIEFEDASGAPFVAQRGVGPVPLLKLRALYRPTESIWLGTEIDGFYAPVSYLNGSTEDVVGAFLDASLRAGYRIDERLQPFLNVRYIGGGATNEDPSDYVENWLNLLSVSLGVSASPGRF